MPSSRRHNMGGGASYQPPPISNYKGVMLCDRPATKAAGGARGTFTEHGGQMPFAAAVGPGSKYEALGLNPSREHRAAKLASDNRTRPRENNDFLSKHRRWLSELDRQRKRRTEEDGQAVQMAVEKTRKFKDYAARLRANIREAKKQHADGGDMADYMSEDRGTARERSVGGTSKKKGRPSSKPAWALTEEGFDDAQEDEVDDLLNFASGLDFDQYIEDYEVRNAIAAVKNRIAELAQAKTRHQGGGGDGGGGAGVDLDESGEDWKKAFVEGWNGAGGGDTGRMETGRSDRSVASRLGTARSQAGDEMETRSVAATERGGGDVSMDVAQEVLATSREMRQVHSSRSIRGILDKKKAAQAKRLGGIREEVPQLPLTQAPPVMQVYHAEDQGVANGGNKGGKKDLDPSNLPYLHRNPAI